MRNLTDSPKSLIVTTLAPKREFAGSSLGWVPKIFSWSGRYRNVRHCRGHSMVLLQLKDSLELFVKRRDFFLVPGFYLIAI